MIELKHLLVGLYINSAVFIAGLLTAAIAWHNKGALCAGLLSAGSAYIGYYLQIAPSKVASAAPIFVGVSIGAAVFGFIDLLFL